MLYYNKNIKNGSMEINLWNKVKDLYAKIFFSWNVNVNQKNIKAIKNSMMNIITKECTIKLNLKGLIVSFIYNLIR